VQYPTVYATGGSRVDPVTSAAKVLFDALANNQPIQLTGSTSDGYGTEVVGEATPTPADPGATPSPTATGDAGATAAAPTPTQEVAAAVVDHRADRGPGDLHRRPALIVP
jgi:hypothetical protein